MHAGVCSLLRRRLFIGYTDGCSEDVTSLGGDLEIVWPESDIGMVTVPCPCGSVTGSINQNATRFCFGNFDERAEWRIANVSSCNFSATALELCQISLVSLLHYRSITVYSFHGLLTLHVLNYHSITV